jgi:CubicO group peptidase (beta-lactamase class C family)
MVVILSFTFTRYLLTTIFLFSPIIFHFNSSAQSIKDNKVYPDSAEAVEYLDSLIIPKLAGINIAGCGIIVVKDTSILFSKGYGFSDAENRIPVYPDRTLFRTASVCKVVTGTSLMKLKEESLIDFNADINSYLNKFEIPRKFGKPITISNLLTHTPGFDDGYIGKSVHSKEESETLGEFLKEYLPARVMPPGEIYTYSNIGIALSAFVLEEITGVDFEEWSREKIFLPLEMNSSSFTLQSFQKDNLSKGYVIMEGMRHEFQFDHLKDYPAGQMLTTLNEFGNFMIMQLNEGRFKGRQILSPESIREMQSTQFTHHPKLHGSIGYTFGIGEAFGMKLLGHDGGYAGIETRMWLFPEIKLGLYIAVNTSGSGMLNEIAGPFMDRFFPYSELEPAVNYPLNDLPSFDKDVDRFTGKYRFTRYSRNSITKIGVLLGFIGDEMPVWAKNEGMLMMYDHNGDERRMIQIEPLLFQSIDDDYYMAFREDESGAITHVFTSGTTALEKTPCYHTITFQRHLFFSLTSIFLIVMIAGLIIMIVQRKKDKDLTLLRLSVTVSAVFLAYLLIFGLAMFLVMSPVEMSIGFAYGFTWYFYLIQLIPFAAILFLILFLYRLTVKIIASSIGKLGITFSLLFTLVCALNIWFMIYWKVLGFYF